MKIGKRQGGSGIGEYFWEHDNDVVNVPTEMGLELLALKGSDHFLVDEAEYNKFISINEARRALQESMVNPIDQVVKAVPIGPDRPPVRGSVAAVTDWVGSDKVRAQQALRAERDHRGEARPSLEAALRNIIDS